MTLHCFHCIQRRNWGAERLSDVLKLLEAVSGKAGTNIQQHGLWRSCRRSGQEEPGPREGGDETYMWQGGARTREPRTPLPFTGSWEAIRLRSQSPECFIPSPCSIAVPPGDRHDRPAFKSDVLESCVWLRLLKAPCESPAAVLLCTREGRGCVPAFCSHSWCRMWDHVPTPPTSLSTWGNWSPGPCGPRICRHPSAWYKMA